MQRWFLFIGQQGIARGLGKTSKTQLGVKAWWGKRKKVNALNYIAHYLVVHCLTSRDIVVGK